MPDILSASAFLVTDPLNQRYFHHLEFAGGVVYLSQRRKVYLSWSGAEKLPDGLELRKILRTELSETLLGLLHEDHTDYLTVEADTPYDLYQELAAVLPHIQVSKENEIAKLREIKTDWELKQLQAACDITDQAFDWILGQLRPGVTELEIAALLEYKMRLLGSEESNKTIVAAGPGGASPHHWPTDYVIQPGDFVTMDYGCTVNGYHSDLTRTVVVGKASAKQHAIYETVLEAQLAGLSALQAGKTGGEIDGIARKIIDQSEFSGSFVHNLGHGIGLDIHEGTGLVRGSDSILQAGMVVSVEPGIYLPGFGGVRIEDIALVKETGAAVLEHSTKELVEL